jgi:hypothetical protein
MSHRTCSRCRRELPLDSFSFKDKARGTRQSTCRECMSAYCRRHHADNRTKRLQQVKAKNRDYVARKRAIRDELIARPCTDCGGTFPPEAMEFDHRQPSEKAADVATLVRDHTGLRKFADELAKCDAVCACCHRIRTRRRRESGRQDLNLRLHDPQPCALPD